MKVGQEGQIADIWRWEDSMTSILSLRTSTPKNITWEGSLTLNSVICPSNCDYPVLCRTLLIGVKQRDLNKCVVFDYFGRFLLDSHTSKLWSDRGTNENNGKCDLGVKWAQGFHIWENIPKYFHKSDSDFKEIKWSYELNYLIWEYTLVLLYLQIKK